MKLLDRRIICFYLTCLSMLLFVSCAQTTPFGEGIRIIVSPQKLNVHSGSEDPVFVQIVDKEGGPLFGMKTTAVSTAPTVATITPEAVTNAAGKARFTVKGISPGTANMVFSVAGQKAMMEVVFLEH